MKSVHHVSTALVALLLPGRAEDVVGGIAVGAVVAAPLVRVIWVAVGWTRERDWRFVAAAAALLVVIASGALVALVS